MAEPTTHITTSGGLISTAFIENIRELGTRQRGIEPESFALPWNPAPKSPRALEETIATAWELLKERWDTVGAELPMMSISQVRTRWLLPLFQLLDFEPVFLRSDTVLDDAGKLRYPLSHRGWEGDGAPVIHTVLSSEGLDGRPATGRGIRAKSPHDMLQAFLNASSPDLWAVLTNGILLRLLRDYHHTFTKGYVQFDLESIFETRNYGDFRALYRMCHASRFVPQGEGDETILPLEQFFKDSIATGIKVGEDLRGQVRQAIETLGNGFLDGDLIRQLQQDEAVCRRYYSEILRIIYRILFLLFAEQRGMLPGRESLYAEAYSIARLRARAEGDIPREDDFTDLWEGLKVTFRMVREGVPGLGVFGYDGMLFEDLETLAEQEGHESLLAGRACRNSDLLRAIRALTLIERERVLQRISYADLGVEELGAIYESLLDFTPRVSTVSETISGREIPANSLFLDPRGKERKTTGSYYTHPSLVNELIKSALLPVARDRLAAAGLPVIEEDAIGEATAGLLTDYAGLTEDQRTAGAAAILSLKVCDPAVGSGHFLVKANNALGAELARICTGDEYPAEAQVQAAKRDVLAHSIYAVDKNPMAIELCKVSLWINASVVDRPLSFLDHHIKSGNSLIGATSELTTDGIPYQAFNPKIVGNHRATANAVRKRNRDEQRQVAQLPLEWGVTVTESREEAERWQELSRLAEDKPQAAREQYAAYCRAEEYRRRQLEADFWTAAFFWPLPEGTEWAPTHGEFVRLRAKGPEALAPEAEAEVEALAEQYHFFQWHLEFPDVFAEDATGGFDCVLGNPPWETLEFKEKEFFSAKDPSISNAPTTAARRKLIAQLKMTNPALAAEHAAALHQSECENEFVRHSGRYPLTISGKLNTYSIFAELARSIINARGRVGIVVQSGIATDYTHREFFQDLMQQESLVSQYDFENRKKLFPDVDSRMKFSLLTLSGNGWPCPGGDFAFFLHNVNDLADKERHFNLSREDLALINPNTRTCPIFRTRRDAELTRILYRRAPVLVNEVTGDNPWAVTFKQGLFNMSTDSHLFRTREQLGVEGFVLEGNAFVRGEEVCLPLYEAKMFQQYDHRAANVVEDMTRLFRPGQPEVVSTEEHIAPGFTVMPRYWVSRARVVEALAGQHPRSWLFGYKNVTSATNERTFISAILPLVAAGHSIQFLFPASPAVMACALVGNLNTLVFDFVARQKLGGINFSYFVLKQLPVLGPGSYTHKLLDLLVPRVVELTYTAWYLQPFALDILGEVGPDTWARWFADTRVHTSPPPAGQPPTPAPFVWDEDRRAHLRAELDALYAHLYGLTRDELSYILDTFPIVRRKDEERYGEYRTKRLVLEQHDILEGILD